MSGHLFVTSSWSELGFCSRTMIQNTPANTPLNGWRKTKWRLWSGLVKVLTWILLRCCGMTLKRRFMLENPPMWLNYNNSAKMSGPKFLHSAVTDSLQVIANAWWQLLLLRVAQPVIRFRGQVLKLHSKTACCVYLCYLWLIFKFVWWSETLKCDKHAKKKKNQEGGQHFFTPLVTFWKQKEGSVLYHHTVHTDLITLVFT